MPQNPPEPRSSVFLLHELPDGTAHVDWLIASEGEGHRPDDRVLTTWRITEESADLLQNPRGEIVEFVGVRLADHRQRYLDYEGPVSEGRGSVLRRGVGGAVVFELSETRFRCLIAIGGVWRISGVRIGPAPSPEDDGPAPLGLWKFSAQSAATSAAGG